MVTRLIVILLLMCGLQNSYAQNYQDCDSPFPICEKKTYNFGYLNGYGRNLENISNTSCFEGSNAKETNSIWLKWEVLDGGTLTFILNPEQEKDDLDFILYKYSNSCESKEEVRCMASGENIGSSIRNSNCNGQTGLRLTSLDDFEKQGCKYNDDNFLKFLSVEPDEQYLLLVNNYNSKSGFSISFDGSADFNMADDCKFINPNEEILITNLFPNPTTNELNVQFITHHEKEYTIKILDIAGKEIYTFSKAASIGLNHNNITVKDFISGTYILVVSADGYSTAKRFIKQ
jgi:hypothetical protein